MKNNIYIYIYFSLQRVQYCSLRGRGTADTTTPKSPEDCSA